MSIDPYQLCPCGSGKKIKFCCRDIAADLQKIQRMIEGKQRLAAVERINKLLEKHKHHQALLGLKSVIEIQLGNWEDAQKTVDELCEFVKESPLGPSQAAILRLREGKTTEAVELLQNAVEKVEGELPQQLYDAYRLVAQALFMGGEYMAAQAHLEFLLSVSEAEDENLVDLMLRTTSDRRIPLLLKEELRIDHFPETVSWAREYKHAIEPAEQGGQWLKSLERLESMCQRVLDEPTILRAAGTLNARLARRTQAAKWFRSASKVRGVDLDDAVFDEALAQLLDPQQLSTVDVVAVSFPIGDVDRLVEKLLSQDRLVSGQPKLPTWHEEGAAPPRNVFTLLDRDCPESGKELTAATVPVMAGTVFIFGKETDCDARAVLEIVKDERFEAGLQSLKDAAGDELADPKEKKVGELPELHVAMSSRWHFPADTPADLRKRLLEEQKTASILTLWPEQELPELDGKTPRAASEEKKYHVSLLASILNMELSAQQSPLNAEFNELRKNLGLPTADTIDPADIDLDRIPLHRLGRLDVSKLSDEELQGLYRESLITAARGSIARFCEEIIGRPSMDEMLDKATVHRTLAELSSNVETSIEHIHKARDIAVGRGDSPAMWLIAELSLRFIQGDGETAGKLLQEIQGRYMNEPGVAQSLFETLAQFGLINPDGTPKSRPQAAEPAGAVAAAPEGGKEGLWTPDSESSQASPDKGSKLWVPGMD